MNIEHVSPQEFLVLLLIELHERGVRLPGPNKPFVWHATFYRLKEEGCPRLPAIRDLFFEAASRYPSAPHITEALANLVASWFIMFTSGSHEYRFNDELVIFFRKERTETIAKLQPELKRAVEIFHEEYAKEYPQTSAG